MKLTNNYTVASKYNAGSWDWGPSYMRGLDKKGWMHNAWESGRYGSDRLFEPWLLQEGKYA